MCILCAASCVINDDDDDDDDDINATDDALHVECAAANSCTDYNIKKLKVRKNKTTWKCTRYSVKVSFGSFNR